MRVVAGSLKGRIFQSPRTKRTHPMSDRMRGALFNVLGDIEGLCLLDAFSGSGAIAIEAISRGAESVVAIERDRRAYMQLEENCNALDISHAFQAVHASAHGWLERNPSRCFDVIIADPPYDDLQLNLLQRLSQRLLNNGTFVLSLPVSEPVPNFPGLKQKHTTQHAQGRLVFYKAA